MLKVAGSGLCLRRTKVVGGEIKLVNGETSALLPHVDRIRNPVAASEAYYCRVKKKSWLASSGPVLTPLAEQRCPPHVSPEIPMWRVLCGGNESPAAARHPVRSTVTLSVFAGSAG